MLILSISNEQLSAVFPFSFTSKGRYSLTVTLRIACLLQGGPFREVQLPDGGACFLVFPLIRGADSGVVAPI